MEKETTIKVSRKTQKKLVKLKYMLDIESYDVLIERILAIVQRFGLAKELEQ